MKATRGHVEEEAQRVFLLFEGACPQCGSPVRAIGIGGTERQLLENGVYYNEVVANGGKPNLWGGTCGGQDCYIELRCDTCGRSYGLSHSHGEWLGG